jgi:hypothetical protein
VEQVQKDGSSMFVCWASVWNHHELLELVKSMFADIEEYVYEESSRKMAEKVVARFIGELETRNNDVQCKLEGRLQSWITERINDLHSSTDSELNLIEPLKKINDLSDSLASADFIKSTWEILASGYTHSRSFNL